MPIQHWGGGILGGILGIVGMGGYRLNHPDCGSTQGVRGWTWGHLDGVDRSRPNLKVQEGLAVPVAGRNSPVRQGGNHAEMGPIAAKMAP